MCDPRIRNLAIVAALMFARSASAEDVQTPSLRAWKVTVETDPLAFAAGGWAGAVGIKPAAIPRWKLSAEILHADLPGAINELAGNDGWSSSVTGVILTPQYFFRADRRGLLVGVLFSAFRWRIAHDSAAGELTMLEPTPHVGYQWFIAHTGFFVTPFAGLAVPIHVAGSAQVDGMTYKVPTVIPFGAVNVGYEF
jgi:hypothetical protein